MVCKKKIVVVSVESNKYFSDFKEAREYAIKLLEAGCTFIKIIEEEDKDC